MSAPGDHPRSREERITSTAPSTIPPSQIQYDPFSVSRQPTWTTEPPFDPFAGRSSRRSSPGSGGVDSWPGRQLFGSPGRDRRFVNNDYVSYPLPFPQSSNTEPIPFSQQDPPSRSAADESLLPFRRDSQSSYLDSPSSSYDAADVPNQIARPHTIRRRVVNNTDEFDGPSQLLPLPLPQQEQRRAGPLLRLPTSLSVAQQDHIAQRTNDILSECAFHFVAKYQFPIPVERDKPRVRQFSDREWTEWAYLLKRLATKRRIPARVLFDGQIRQLVTTLENSIAVRQTTSTRSDQPAQRQARERDDRYMLQLISSGLQVARILMDSVALQSLNELYEQTELLISQRQSLATSGSSSGSRSSIGAGRSSRGSRGSLGGRGVGSGGGGSTGGGGGGGGVGGGGGGGAFGGGGLLPGY